MAESTLSVLLEQVKARYDVTTRGPWRVRGEGGTVPYYYVVSADGKHLIAVVGTFDNATFIAHTYTDMGKLIGLVDHILRDHASAVPAATGERVVEDRQIEGAHAEFCDRRVSEVPVPICFGDTAVVEHDECGACKVAFKGGLAAGRAEAAGRIKQHIEKMVGLAAGSPHLASAFADRAAILKDVLRIVEEKP